MYGDKSFLRVVGRITVPEDMQVLILRSWEYVTLGGRGDYVPGLEMMRLGWITQVGLI